MINTNEITNVVENDEFSSRSEKNSQNKSIFSIERKWGKEIIKDGFTAIPNQLLQKQREKNLSNNHVMVIINIISFWWEKERNPFPSKRILSDRMGVSERQVQRYISELINIGALRRSVYINKEKTGRNIVEFDMDHLIKFLRE